MNSRILNLAVLTIFLFLAIFGWKVSPLIDISILACIPALILTCDKPTLLLQSVVKSKYVSIPLFLLTLYCVSIYAFNDPSSPQWILRTIRAAITFGTVFLITDRYLRIEGGERMLLSALTIAITFHATIALATQANTELRHEVYALTNAASYVNKMTLIADNRPLGLTYSLSITSFLYFIAVCILATNGSTQIRSPLLVFVFASLNISACMITARTGLLFMPLALLFYIKKFKTLTVKDTVFILSACALIFLFCFIAINMERTSAQMTRDRLSDIVVLITAPSESPLARQFATMWRLPSFPDAIFGNSLTGREPNHYVPSDIGYILTLHGVGIVGTALMITPIVTGIFLSWRIIKTEQRIALLNLIVLSAYLLLNIKELSLLTRTTWPAICLLVSIVVILHRKQRNHSHAEKMAQ